MEAEHHALNRTVDRTPRLQALPRKRGTQKKVRVSSSKLNISLRRLCINLDESRRSNNRRHQHLVKQLLIPEHFPVLSIQLSGVLNDIGVGKCTVMERRKTYLRRERMMTITRLGDIKTECFHFGSQSEGTTTPGLNSDIDSLSSFYKINIMTEWRDWVAGMVNLLMLRDNTTPPQQYLLQAIKTYTPEAITCIESDLFVRKDSREILLSSERCKQNSEMILSVLGKVIKNGPSVSLLINYDSVQAFHVCKLLPEIQHWIDKCRGKHWPPFQILEAARVAPSFLVPAGHTDSDYKREEWRLSSNLIERMLMFSFNMTQIKCYIVLKLIKKSLFNKMVGNGITSFHCKTLMFYTIERTHHSIWKEHNLIYLLVLCLQVLRKWLRLGSFPHYIIEGVNLFDGKLSMVQQRRLLQYVNNMIKHDLHELFYIDIDKLGNRLKAFGIQRFGRAGEGELGPVFLRRSISVFLKFEFLQVFLMHFQKLIYEIYTSNTTFEQALQNMLRTVFEYSTNFRLKPVTLELIDNMYALHNSMHACKCWRIRNPAFSKIIRRFQYSLNTDVASNRLKLASTLYCFGYLQAAIRVLEDVEKRYHNKVKALCGCCGPKGDLDLKVFANMISDDSNNVFHKPPNAFCVNFVRQEANCAPYILWFEMNRGMTEEEVVHRYYFNKQWMDFAEVSARPFLHYLQYLTYGGLGERDKQIDALRKFALYKIDRRNEVNIYHAETVTNLLGHCYEMEGNYAMALNCYEGSLRSLNTNNAANWHVQRVQRLISSLE